MSEDRKVLVPKRGSDRSKDARWTAGNKYVQDCEHSRRGNKRPMFSNNAPKKNLANDRLKRLRTSLNEEAEKGSSGHSKNCLDANAHNNKPIRHLKNINTRKRPNRSFEEPVSVKLPKKPETDFTSTVNKTSLICKTGCDSQKSVFTATASTFLKEALVSTDNMEDMEWSTADGELTVTTVNTCPCVGDMAQESDKTISDKKFKNYFLIVVDTNVFLSHLQILKDVIAKNIQGTINPVIYIPWMVMEELDFIKEDHAKTSLKFKAQVAIKYIESILSTERDQVMGQTLDEANKQRVSGKSPDNKIIACCLQVLDKYQNMILVTSDINLRNKAHINNIPVCAPGEIMTKISSLNQTKAQTILNIMTNLCSTIISECAKRAYGPACCKMPICQRPRKTLQDCLTTFTKYWFPVFQEILLKQFKKAIDDLSNFLTKNKNIADNSNDFNELLKLCIRVCLFLKDVECCKDIIENTIHDLNNIRKL